MKEYILWIIGVIALGFGVNLIASAQTLPADPIIIVPGISASWNLNILTDTTPVTSLENWEFTPFVKQYDQLIKALEDKGLVKDQDFFVAFYDWRQSNDDSAQDYLVPIIDKALQHTESGKVDIIAHSMGGILARSYMQSDEYRNDVDQLVMLGTPNYGSSDVYTLWEGGLIPENWNLGQVAALNFYIWYLTAVTALTGNAYDTIHTFVPSVRELLPTYDYLVDKDSGDLKPFGGMQERNLLLSVLNADDALIDLALNGTTGGVYTIAGIEESTVGDIPVVPHTTEDGKLWVDGKPDPLSPVRNNAQGDNRVLLSSAFLKDFPPTPSFRQLSPLQKLAHLFLPEAQAQNFLFDQRTIASKHGDLPTHSINAVFTILGLEAPTQTYALIPEPEEILSFWFASPVDVIVRDSLGRHTSSSTNTIPGAIYDGEDDPLGVKIVLIENPSAGDYTVELTGLSQGSYHFASSHFGPQPPTIQTVERAIEPGEKIAYVVSFNPESPTSTISVSKPFTPEAPPGDNPLALLSALITYIQSAEAQAIIGPKTAKKILVPLQTAKRQLLRAEELLTSTHPQRERNTLILQRFAVVQLQLLMNALERDGSKNIPEDVSSTLRTDTQKIIALLQAT